MGKVIIFLLSKDIFGNPSSKWASLKNAKGLAIIGSLFPSLFTHLYPISLEQLWNLMLGVTCMERTLFRFPIFHLLLKSHLGKQFLIAIFISTCMQYTKIMFIMGSWYMYIEKQFNMLLFLLYHKVAFFLKIMPWLSIRTINLYLLT